MRTIPAVPDDRQMSPFIAKLGQSFRFSGIKVLGGTVSRGLSGIGVVATTANIDPTRQRSCHSFQAKTDSTH